MNLVLSPYLFRNGRGCTFSDEFAEINGITYTYFV